MRFPKPAMHDWPHTPLEQAQLAFAPQMHVLPHAPQLNRSVMRDVSQPFARVPSQLAVPAAQRFSHDPATHVAGALVAAAHTVVHRPQWLAFVALATSQPSDNVPLQLTYPLLHRTEQVPDAHDAVPLAPTVQAVPHAPQLPTVCSEASHPFAATMSQLP